MQDCGMLTVRSNQPAQRDVVMDLIAGRRRAVLQFSEAVPRAADPRPAEESVGASNQHERSDGIVDVCQPLERRVCAEGIGPVRRGMGGTGWSARGAVRRLTAGCTLEPWNHTSKRAKLHHLSVRQDRAVLYRRRASSSAGWSPGGTQCTACSPCTAPARRAARRACSPRCSCGHSADVMIAVNKLVSRPTNSKFGSPCPHE